MKGSRTVLKLPPVSSRAEKMSGVEDKRSYKCNRAS